MGSCRRRPWEPQTSELFTTPFYFAILVPAFKQAKLPFPSIPRLTPSFRYFKQSPLAQHPALNPL